MVVWMVRSGSGGRYAEECRERNLVGMGWQDIADPNRFESKADLQREIAVTYPEYKEGQVASAANQLWRFRTELQIGDSVVTYDSGSRIYHFGQIASEAVFKPEEIEDIAFQRKVDWLAKPVSRDHLSDDARNRLGSVLTLFKLPNQTAAEISALVSGKQTSGSMPDSSPDFDEESDPFESITEVAKLRVGDRIASLNWKEMQDLVAALLRAMNYKTEISPDGADRGKDIIASPDGFGFEQPRIVVEVKHRRGEKIDAPALRAFMGGRHKDDRGLYVSTGGFTKDAYYEADRSNIPLKLMTLDELAKAVIENYDEFDASGRALIPLKRIYWPA